MRLLMPPFYHHPPLVRIRSVLCRLGRRGRRFPAERFLPARILLLMAPPRVGPRLRAARRPRFRTHIPHPDSALFGNIGISHKSWHDEALQQSTEYIPRLPVPWYVVTNGINSTRFMRK